LFAGQVAEDIALQATNDFQKNADERLAQQTSNKIQVLQQDISINGGEAEQKPDELAADLDVIVVEKPQQSKLIEPILSDSQAVLDQILNETDGYKQAQQTPIEKYNQIDALAALNFVTGKIQPHATNEEVPDLSKETIEDTDFELVQISEKGPTQEKNNATTEEVPDLSKETIEDTDLELLQVSEKGPTQEKTIAIIAISVSLLLLSIPLICLLHNRLKNRKNNEMLRLFNKNQPLLPVSNSHPVCNFTVESQELRPLSKFSIKYSVTSKELRPVSDYTAISFEDFTVKDFDESKELRPLSNYMINHRLSNYTELSFDESVGIRPESIYTLKSFVQPNESLLDVDLKSSTEENYGINFQSAGSVELSQIGSFNNHEIHSFQYSNQKPNSILSKASSGYYPLSLFNVNVKSPVMILNVKKDECSSRTETKNIRSSLLLPNFEYDSEIIFPITKIF
jgi:hypothetical protein